MKLYSPMILLFSVLFALSCKEKPSEIDNSNPQSQTRKERKYDQAQDFTYSIWAINSDEERRKAFKSQFSVPEITIILSLNRIDKNHLGNVDTLVVPDTFDDWMAYSPFPFSLDAIAEVPKMAIFSYPIQAYGLYEYGDLIKWGPSSLGKQASLTPTGLFFANWKGEEIQSTANDEWILKWNFNIENLQGIGWHEYALPGYPASSSCLRLLEKDAKWMYEWADEWVLDKS
jgi:lipoprotein-anchoring transpeptidase ErfK/SrfK